MSLDRRIWTIARLAALLLVLVSLRIIYWQMLRASDLQPVAVDLVQAAGSYADVEQGRAEEIRSMVEFLTGVSSLETLSSLPQPVIQRTMNFLETVQRGAIYDRNKRLLASDTVLPDGEVVRYYTEPSLAHVIGYVSGLRTGVTGLERSYNRALLGLDRADTQVSQMLNKPITGSDLVLSLDSAVQRAAQSALEGKAGAILVLDGQSGAVLAMASAPGFDPNRVLDSEYVAGLLEGCSTPTCQAPFLNRAAQALYPPGSTWKTITLIAGLESGQVAPDTVFDFGEPVQGENGPVYMYRVGGGTVPDPNHSERRLDLGMAYAKSANAAFAQIGDEMPAGTLVEYAARFGFGAPGEILFPLEIESSPAQLAQDLRSLYENDLLRAVTAIGQGELLTSPLNIGILVLSVVNEGSMPVPYFVQAIEEPGGRRLEDLPNRSMRERVMEAETARQVRQMMLQAVEDGSGRNAQIPGAVVGGKTGTAQLGGDRDPHSWFAGFAEAEDRTVVAIVVIENGGEGSKMAAPIFSQVASAALFHLGEPVAEIIPQPTQALEASPEPAEPAPEPTSTPPSPGQAETPTGGEPTQAMTPIPPQPPAPTPTLEGVLPPEILRDLTQSDLSAEKPACAELKDMPQATGEWIWPSSYQALSGGDFKEGHPGLDLSAPPGSPVYAADTGLVVFAGWSGLGYGNVILIDHGNGYQSLYAHLSQVSTYCGAKVEKGKLIGLSGNTGNSTGPHLHFEVRVPGGYINPLNVLPLP